MILRVGIFLKIIFCIANTQTQKKNPQLFQDIHEGSYNKIWTMRIYFHLMLCCCCFFVLVIYVSLLCFISSFFFKKIIDLKESQLTKILQYYFLLLLKIGSVGPIDQNINLASPDVKYITTYTNQHTTRSQMVGIA